MAANGANSSAVDILYLVRTAGAHHTTRLPAVLSTWAAALPRLLVVSERDDAAAAALVAKRGGRFVVCSHHRADADGDLDDDAWLGAVVGGLASRDEADAAAWRLDVHALAGAAEGDAPCVYVFTKCRSHRGAGLEVEFHEHG